jgi:hypothetical protein
MGQNVTVLEDVMKQAGKMSQSGHFVTIQVKKGGFLSQLHHVRPQGWVDIKSWDISSGDDMSQ